MSERVAVAHLEELLEAHGEWQESFDLYHDFITPRLTAALAEAEFWLADREERAWQAAKAEPESDA